MRSFTKKIFVASLLLSSTSALAVFPDIPKSPDASRIPSFSENLTYSDNAKVLFDFENEAQYTASITISFQRKIPNTYKFERKIEQFDLKPGAIMRIMQKGDDAFVNIHARIKENEILGRLIFNENQCGYNNNYTRKNDDKSRQNKKDFVFRGDAARPLTFYKTSVLEKEGYKPSQQFNGATYTCWNPIYII